MSGFSQRSRVSNSISQLWTLLVPLCIAFLVGMWMRTRRVRMCSEGTPLIDDKSVCKCNWKVDEICLSWTFRTRIRTSVGIEILSFSFCCSARRLGLMTRSTSTCGASWCLLASVMLLAQRNDGTAKLRPLFENWKEELFVFVSHTLPNTHGRRVMSYNNKRRPLFVAAICRLTPRSLAYSWVLAHTERPRQRMSDVIFVDTSRLQRNLAKRTSEKLQTADENTIHDWREIIVTAQTADDGIQQFRSNWELKSWGFYILSTFWLSCIFSNTNNTHITSLNNEVSNNTWNNYLKLCSRSSAVRLFESTWDDMSQQYLQEYIGVRDEIPHKVIEIVFL